MTPGSSLSAGRRGADATPLLSLASAAAPDEFAPDTLVSDTDADGGVSVVVALGTAASGGVVAVARPDSQGA